jgi:hypothetical protein
LIRPSRASVIPANSRRERRRINRSGILEEVTGNAGREDLKQTNALLRSDVAVEVADEAIPAATKSGLKTSKKWAARKATWKPQPL